MTGSEIERLLALLDNGRNERREEFVRYVVEHKDQITADLEKHGEVTIPGPDGDIVLRLRVAASDAGPTKWWN